MLHWVRIHATRAFPNSGVGEASFASQRYRRRAYAALDTMGRHRATCPRSGLLKIKAQGLERSLARICREAGASVRFNTKLRDMNVAVSANDERAIEVLASGLPLYQDAQLAVDITVRSATTSTELRRRVCRHDGGSPGTSGSASVATVSTPRLAWQVEVDVGGVMRSRVCRFFGVQGVGHSGHRRGRARSGGPLPEVRVGCSVVPCGFDFC